MSSKIVNSPLPDVDIPLVSLSKFLLQRMRHFGDKEFLVS
jgi:hypothetical protein